VVDVKFNKQIDATGTETTINSDAILLDVLKENVITNSVETKLMLLENYDIHFGIFDHNLYKDRPYSLIEMHEAERFDLVNPLYEIIERFAQKEVVKHFGLSLTEFLELPRDEVLKIFEICDKIHEADNKRTIPLLNDLEAMSKMK
jgi:hypothetical protein